MEKKKKILVIVMYILLVGGLGFSFYEWYNFKTDNNKLIKKEKEVLTNIKNGENEITKIDDDIDKIKEEKKEEVEVYNKWVERKEKVEKLME